MVLSCLSPSSGMPRSACAALAAGALSKEHLPSCKVVSSLHISPLAWDGRSRARRSQQKLQRHDGLTYMCVHINCIITWAKPAVGGPQWADEDVLQETFFSGHG